MGPRGPGPGPRASSPGTIQVRPPARSANRVMVGMSRPVHGLGRIDQVTAVEELAKELNIDDTGFPGGKLLLEPELLKR